MPLPADATIIASLGVTFRRVIYIYSGGNLQYMGANIDRNAATSDNTWIVWRFVWSGDDITDKQIIEGVAWDDRATLPWV